MYQSRNFNIHARSHGYVLFKKDVHHHYGAFQDDTEFEPKELYKNHKIEITKEAKELGCKIRHRIKDRNYIHVINPFTHPECFNHVPKTADIDISKFKPKSNAIELIVAKMSQLDPRMSPFFEYQPPKFEVRPANIFDN